MHMIDLKEVEKAAGHRMKMALRLVLVPFPLS
jgi:hypothetical protein